MCIRDRLGVFGLGIAYDIVRAHGGVIKAHNVKDKDGFIVGASFTIILPSYLPFAKKSKDAKWKFDRISVC